VSSIEWKLRREWTRFQASSLVSYASSCTMSSRRGPRGIEQPPPMQRQRRFKLKTSRGSCCDGSWGKDVTCATCVILVLLPLLYKLFLAHICITYTSCKQTIEIALHKAITTAHRQNNNHQHMHSNFLTLLALLHMPNLYIREALKLLIWRAENQRVDPIVPHSEGNISRSHLVAY
jgi:hypothetical protein